MGLGEAALFGIVQGIAEFLPVSSSGHLAVLKSIWGYADLSILFDILLHFATLLAVVLVFRKTIFKLIGSLFRGFSVLLRFRSGDEARLDESDRVYLRLVGYILLASVVTAVMGIGIEQFFLAEGVNRSFVGICFFVTAIILVWSGFRKQGAGGYGELKSGQALFCGFAQGLGVFPGISRSGITISAGVFMGLKREEAGEFSFLLSIPAILGAAILKLDQLDGLQASISTPALMVGMISSFISGLLALLLLMRLVRSGKLHYFAFYLVPLAAYCIFFS